MHSSNLSPEAQGGARVCWAARKHKAAAGEMASIQHSALLLQGDPVKARHDTQLTKSIAGQASHVRLFCPAGRWKTDPPKPNHHPLYTALLLGFLVGGGRGENREGRG